MTIMTRNPTNQRNHVKDGLDLSGKLLALSRNHVKLIVGKLASLFQHVALQLLPVAFNTIPVHCPLLTSVGK
jgi:hypothetical protein